MTPATIKVLLSHLIRMPFGIECRSQTRFYNRSATPFRLLVKNITQLADDVKDFLQTAQIQDFLQTAQIQFINWILQFHFF